MTELNAKSPIGDINWILTSAAFVIATWAAGLVDTTAFQYMIQDDARRFVSFMQRWLDPALFPDDPIADYFLAVTPPGYKFVHWLPAQVGIAPQTTNKFLPLILVAATGFFSFCLGRTLGGSPRAGAIVCIMTTGVLSLSDHLSGGSPRSFAFPLLIAFLCFLPKRSTAGLAVSVVLLSITYPAGALIALLTIALAAVKWSTWPPRLVGDSKERRMIALVLLLGGLPLIAFATSVGPFGPTLAVEQGQQLALLQSGGSYPYFEGSFLHSILCSKRAGLLIIGPVCSPPLGLSPTLQVLLIPLTILATYILPIALWRQARIDRSGLDDPLACLLPFMLASLILFASAHIVLFELHLPGRYGQIPGLILTTTGLGLLADRLLPLLRLSSVPGYQGFISIGSFRYAPKFCAIVLCMAPFLLSSYPAMNQERGHLGRIYDFLRNDRYGGAVATLSTEGGVIPSFSGRSVVAAVTFMAPYSWGFYREIDRRSRAQLEAHYTDDLSVLLAFIHEYRVAYFLVERGTFSDRWLAQSSWSRDYPEITAKAHLNLEGQHVPILEQVMSSCIASQENDFTLIDAKCVSDLDVRRVVQLPKSSGSP